MKFEAGNNMELKSEQLTELRREYQSRSFDETDVKKDPFTQFGLWFNEALKADVNEPNAMCLSTTTVDGRPSARIVLLKGFDEKGLTFFTNYDSHKGRLLDSNPYVALTFFWPELERQVRIEGKSEKISAEDSDKYFSSRPVSSQWGAHASPQSRQVESRKVLEEKYNEISKKYQTGKVPRPANWGGYLVRPDMFEFWQGRSSRLHDRFKFTPQGTSWVSGRLAP
jgi:pyridoxamine 5'-phosphate oxidase